jgi:hypothetical protein
VWTREAEEGALVLQETPHMEKRMHVQLVSALAVGVALASAALAQNEGSPTPNFALGSPEQWLQYHSANEARQIVPDTGYQYLRPSSTRPEGLKLPAFKCDQPLFLEWKTPMVASGRIWMAFDKSSPKGQYDRLYFDANADGDLSNDPVYQPYRRDSERVFFGPVKAVFAAADGPITYHLSVELRTYSGQTDCLLSPGCWYEGQITVGGVKKRCLLVDYNVNGAFNDKSPDYYQSDRIRLGETTGLDGGAVGNYLEADGKLYRIEIARDGACVTLSEAKDVSYGTVRLAEGITTVIVSGENGSFIRQPEKGTIRLPIGDYGLDSWTIVRKDDTGARWEMRAAGSSPGTGRLTVASDQEASLSLGEPVYSIVESNKDGLVYLLNQRLEGRQGERITLTRNGAQPAPPKVHIRSKDGVYDRVMTLEYG